MVRFIDPQTKHDELAPPIADARRMLAEGKSLEEVWCHLRAIGYDMFDSKLVTVEVTGMARHEAKHALHHSQAWADMRPATEQLHDDLIEAALEMGATVRIDGQLIESMDDLRRADQAAADSVDAPR